MTSNEIIEYLSAHFEYDNKSGNFITIKPQSRSNKVGDIAGRIQSNGYRRISIKRKFYQAHRLVWVFFYGEMPSGDIDHINGVKSDNRIENLRNVSHRENTQNRRRLHARNTTGYRGVTFSRGMYEARIWIETSIVLGRFKDPELAELVYLEAKSKYHGGCNIWQSSAAM